MKSVLPVRKPLKSHLRQFAFIQSAVGRPDGFGQAIFLRGDRNHFGIIARLAEDLTGKSYQLI